MPYFERLHFSRASCFTTTLHDRRDLIVNSHERKRTRWLTAAGKLFTTRTQRRKVRTGTRTEFKKKGFTGRKTHDRFHVVFHTLNEAGTRLRKFVRILRLNRFMSFLVPAPVTFCSFHFILVVKTNIEPNRRIKRNMLMQTQPGQLAIKILAILLRREITVPKSPVGYRPTHAMNQLPYAVLSL